MNRIKQYLIGRVTDVTAWIGLLGFVLEIILHLGNVSMIMLILFVVLIIKPESEWRKMADEMNDVVRKL